MILPRAAPRVVAAVTRDLRSRITAVLPGCELCFVQTGSELVHALDEAHCDLMIVEVHFDDSAAVAALRCVLSREETFPVVCVRNVPFARLGHAALDSLRTALRAVGVAQFIDLLGHPEDQAGNERVGVMLTGLLPVRAGRAAA
jgi:hypothetical protein